jgi:hypothetical protein
MRVMGFFRQSANSQWCTMVPFFGFDGEFQVRP